MEVTLGEKTEVDGEQRVLVKGGREMGMELLTRVGKDSGYKKSGVPFGNICTYLYSISSQYPETFVSSIPHNECDTVLFRISDLFPQ